MRSCCRRKSSASLEVVERRVVERLPAPYLTHEAWLGEYRFYVDERVIVPRSHLAGLIEQGLHAWLPQPDRVRRALDLCTGSGCLAIVLALTFATAAVDAADISPEALQVAQRNVADYRLQRAHQAGAVGPVRGPAGSAL